MKHLPIAVILILIIWLCSPCTATELNSSQALAEAEQFVATIDVSKYSQAYNSASPYLHLSKLEKEWIDEQTRTRKLIGQPLSRQLKGIRSRETYPGLPDGNYLLAHYQTRTEHKSKATEIILLLQQENQWQVCLYYFK